jgi:hypothetical protein
MSVFADQRWKSLGIRIVLLPKPGEILRLDVDVVQPDIPMLLGIYILDGHELQFLNTKNSVEAFKTGWKLPVVRKRPCVHFVAKRFSYHVLEIAT